MHESQNEIDQLRNELRQLHRDKGGAKAIIESLIELAGDSGHKNDRRVSDALRFMKNGMTDGDGS